MNRAAFYAALRKRGSGVFGTSLRPTQVRGIDAILDEADRRGTPLQHLSYIFATAYHEVGGRMQPVRESLNYSVTGLLKSFGRHRISEADARRYGRSGSRPANQQAIANTIYGGEFGRTQLGNTKPGDGWFYRGGGLAQTTGRRNYTLLGMAADPDRSADLLPSVRMLFDAMERGIYTGKSLSDFTSYVAMRAIINGTDKAQLIASYAEIFERALQAAGVSEATKTPPQAHAKPQAPPAMPDTPARRPANPAPAISLIGIALGALAYWWAEVTEKIGAWFSQFFGG